MVGAALHAPEPIAHRLAHGRGRVGDGRQHLLEVRRGRQEQPLAHGVPRAVGLRDVLSPAVVGRPVGPSRGRAVEHRCVGCIPVELGKQEQAVGVERARVVPAVGQIGHPEELRRPEPFGPAEVDALDDRLVALDLDDERLLRDAQAIDDIRLDAGGRNVPRGANRVALELHALQLGGDLRRSWREGATVGRGEVDPPTRHGVHRLTVVHELHVAECARGRGIAVLQPAIGATVGQHIGLALTADRVGEILGLVQRQNGLLPCREGQLRRPGLEGERPELLLEELARAQVDGPRIRIADVGEAEADELQRVLQALELSPRQPAVHHEPVLVGDVAQANARLGALGVAEDDIDPREGRGRIGRPAPRVAIVPEVHALPGVGNGDRLLGADEDPRIGPAGDVDELRRVVRIDPLFVRPVEPALGVVALDHPAGHVVEGDERRALLGAPGHLIGLLARRAGVRIGLAGRVDDGCLGQGRDPSNEQE